MCPSKQSGGWSGRWGAEAKKAVDTSFLRVCLTMLLDTATAYFHRTWISHQQCQKFIFLPILFFAHGAFPLQRPTPLVSPPVALPSHRAPADQELLLHISPLLSLSFFPFNSAPCPSPDPPVSPLLLSPRFPQPLPPPPQKVLLSRCPTTSSTSTPSRPPAPVPPSPSPSSALPSAREVTSSSREGLARWVFRVSIAAETGALLGGSRSRTAHFHVDPCSLCGDRPLWTGPRGNTGSSLALEAMGVRDVIGAWDCPSRDSKSRLSAAALPIVTQC